MIAGDEVDSSDVLLSVTGSNVDFVADGVPLGPCFHCGSGLAQADDVVFEVIESTELCHEYILGRCIFQPRP